MLTPFHLAYNVRDLDETRAFYGDVLGCTEGRSTETWVDYSFFGHQISMHLGEPFKTEATGKVGDRTLAAFRRGTGRASDHVLPRPVGQSD